MEFNTYGINSGIPAGYDYINIYNSSIKPSTVHLNNNQTQRFFAKYLLQEVMSVYKWSGIPEEWNADFFRYILLMHGHIAVFNTEQYGVICMNAQPFGRGLYYQPTHMVIANPLLPGMKQLRIGEECEVIRIQPDWSGISDLVSFYSSMMALSAEAAAYNVQNSKLAYVFIAKDKAQAESFKKLYDQIAQGNPAAVADAKLFDEDGNPRWVMFNQQLKQTYIAPDIMADMHRWKNLFLTEIGIPNANYEKSERLITNEVNANNTETMSKAELWLEEMKSCCDRVNSMYGLQLDVQLRFDPDEQLQKDPAEQQAEDLKTWQE